MPFETIKPVKQRRKRSMLTIVGLLLVLIGTPMAVWGIYRSVSPLLETYATALNDPIGKNDDAMDGTKISKQMTVHLPMGILGGAITVIGSAMLTYALGRRIMQRLYGKM